MQQLIHRARPSGALAIRIAALAAATIAGMIVLALTAGRPAAGQSDEIGHAISCLGGGGRVDTNVHNSGDSPARYRIEFANLSAREIVVAPNDWGRMSITGRPAGSHQLRVSRDGQTLTDRTVEIDCNSERPPVSEDDVQIINACRDGNGYFLFQFVNDSAESAAYVLQTDSVPNRSTTAAPWGASVRAVTGRYDGDFGVRIMRNGREFLTANLTVACDRNQATPTPTPTTQAPTPTPVGVNDLVWGYDDTPPAPNRQRPALNAPGTDPVYGTSVRRVTSAEGTRFNRNTYSRRQAENADGTRFMTYHGDATYNVYQRSTGVLVRVLDIDPGAWPQWHPSDPNAVRYNGGANSSVGDLQLHQVDVMTGQTTVLADLTGRIQAQLPGALYMHDRAEGSPSRDGNRWSWLVYDDAEDIIGIVSYDLSTDTILGVRPSAQFQSTEPLDWVSASPTGEYVLAGHWDGTWVYDADLSNPRLVFAGAEHSDIALGANGRDAYVYIDFTASAEGGWLVSVDLDTLEHTQIFDLYDDANTSIHISGKGYAKPGWVVASTYNCKVPGAWSCEKVMAVELAPNGRVLNLAHTYNCGESYWTETHAVVNTDFTRVYFNTDHGSCGIDAEVMLLDVPAF